METLTLRNLAIGYSNGHHATAVVAEGINAAIHSGKLICLLGANGVGKSTLLRTLCGFQPKLHGQILLQGQPIETFTKKQLAREVCVVLTEKPELTNLTVADVVGLGRSPYTGFWGSLAAADHQIVNHSLQTVGIAHMADRNMPTLSDGERQKVMIAKALAQQTPTIILDEPTAFLDYPSKVDVMQLLRRLAHQMQKTVFLSTHDLEIALQLADELWLMTAGGNLQIGSPHELVLSGALPAFVERKGIRFDTHTRTIRLTDVAE